MIQLQGHNRMSEREREGEGCDEISKKKSQQNSLQKRQKKLKNEKNSEINRIEKQ